jgi:SH3 domain-containing YSC84-like protein 1
LAGKGLEERLILAREPIRVCRPCYAVLQPLQPDLIRNNSNAVRYNWIDPTDVRRLFNSPIAFTLGHEIRKAAYTLNNLLPLPKRRPGALFSDVMQHHNVELDGIRNELQQQCRDQCQLVAEEHVKIPALLLEKAKGIAVVTVLKGGFGVAGFEVGTGLVVVRLGGDGDAPQQQWSAPSAIGLAGVCWGALIGAQVSDHVFLLMTDDAVQLMMSGKQQVQLGADVGVAVGPVGRTLEGGWGVGGHAAGAAAVAPIYTYSLSKGLYAGASLDGKVVTTRDDVNEKFYGYAVRPEHILNGCVPAPPAAQPLYEALQRCHVYASVADQVNHRRVSNNETATVAAEYGEFQNTPFGGHSVITSLSDITNDR